MAKSNAKATLAVAVMCLLPAMSVLAADLVVKVDNSKNTVAVTNTLGTNVTLLFLESTDRLNVPVYAKLAPGATVNVPLHTPMPAAVTDAVCDVSGQRRYLTVDLQ